MTPIPPSVFTNSDVRLRIWFSDRRGGDRQDGFQQLTPDQRITSMAYSMVAAIAESVADGSITSSHLANGAVTPAKLSPGAVGAAQLAPGAALSNLLAGGQSTVPGGGIILGLQPGEPSLLSAGYVNIGPFFQVADRWETRRTGPSKRWWHTAVWTGTEMIVWGGGAGVFLNDGGRYNLAADLWEPVSLENAPSGRWYHRAVWTGTEMIIWGGRSSFAPTSGIKGDGARYNPISNSWTPVSTNNAASPRSQGAMLWTGTEMLVWSGFGDGGLNLSTGGRYNPVSNAWTPTSTNGAPRGRLNMAAVWTGEEMVIWGGGDLFPDGSLKQTFGDGARYRPSTDSWRPISTNGAPPAAASPLAVWSGREMIIWGGFDFGTRRTLDTGGRYNPITDTWLPISKNNAPAEREISGSAVWTGTEMVVWGGPRFDPAFHVWNDGARYNPATDTWTPLAMVNAPSARLAHTAVWTGQSMLVFGGYNNETGANELDSNHSWTPGSAMYLYQRP